jgi:hypothetical protein
MPRCQLTDDNLWRLTRRAEEHHNKEKLWTATRGRPQYSIGCLSTRGPWVIRAARLI